ncbi:MAG: hypothetical protein Q9219_002679 [cf. Caloplaca sp. 3 TL-2023]
MPSLAGIPQELLEAIVEDLELDSLCNLRLTCRTLRELLYCPRFKSFFARQTTDLTLQSLERLRQLAAHPKLGPAVRTLRILAVVIDVGKYNYRVVTKSRRVHEYSRVSSITSEAQAGEVEIEEAQQSSEQLLTLQQEQQKMIRNNSELHGLVGALRIWKQLDTVALQAAVVQTPGQYTLASSLRDWRLVWIRAAQVYRTVTEAIASSSVMIHTLDICKRSTRCRIPIWDIRDHMSMLQSVDFAATAKHIRNFFLSVSVVDETESERSLRTSAVDIDRSGIPAHALFAKAGRQNYRGVALLLKEMPNLECLDMHLFRTSNSHHPRSYTKIFLSMANELVLQSLRHCVLRGLYVEESSLLIFLRTHDHLQTLELHEIHLTTGSWSPIFSHLCKMPLLQQVKLDSLWAPPKNLVHLASNHQPHDDDPKKPVWRADNTTSFPCMDGTKVYARDFSRDEILREKFDFAQGPNGPPLGSPSAHQWHSTRRIQYGPP